MFKNIPNEEMYLKISDWLDIYHSTDNSKKRTKYKTLIVSQMIPVVKRIAKTIARRSTDPIEDMIQAGFIGLLKAIDRYSREKNDNFRVYAGFLIIGEMKHFLRDKLNAIRVPGYIQELSIRINNFTRDLTPEEVGRLTSEEVADALQIPTQAVDFAMMADRRRSIVSLDDSFNSSDDSLIYEELISKDDYKEQSNFEDAKIIFKDILYKLPEEEQIFFDMYYNKDMTQKEIADELNMTQMSVSRRMKKIFRIITEIVLKREP